MNSPVLRVESKFPAQEWKVKSAKTDNIYTLELWGDHRFRCTCPRFMYHGNQTCKHIQAKRHEIENLYGNIHNYLEMLKERKKDAN